MLSFFKRHPLATVLAVAVILRILAVIFAQGYMAHDDHFETVKIAWEWHHEGIFLEDGSLRWEGKPDIGVLRSVVYNLFLLAEMKVTAALGVDYLDIHMYFDRAVHALLSLLPILFGFYYLRKETDLSTAVTGGLLLAAYGMMPFFAVKNLVEMAAADFLLPCLILAHFSMKRRSNAMVIVAAVLGGIAFMIRFHVGLALVAVPFAMVIQGRRWKQAVLFSIGVLAMVALQGLIDIWSHCRFLGSVINYITGNLGAPPTIPGPWYKYILLIFGIMIPPFSILFVLSIFGRDVIRKHLILLLSFIIFVAGHSAVVNKQERFIIPVFPALLVLGCVGLYYLYYNSGWYFKWKGLRTFLWGWFVVFNTALLVLFTFNYSHKGAVEPMVYLSRQDNVDGVIFDCTERRKWLPYSYWNHKKPEAVKLTPDYGLKDAINSGQVRPSDPPQYIVVFADGKPNMYIERYKNYLAEYEAVFHGEPSLMDIILHRLNPKYNHLNESWVLELVDPPN
ncbi:MAG: hypothetical protein GF310_10290 [candidate division Zixibacteria bacterium]|nr:hypothetical protein [candidate division Zixibacteria bacterium]